MAVNDLLSITSWHERYAPSSSRFLPVQYPESFAAVTACKAFVKTAARCMRISSAFIPQTHCLLTVKHNVRSTFLPASNQ
eukprot:5247647-Amphidinium_carterae.1